MYMWLDRFSPSEGLYLRDRLQRTGCDEFLAANRTKASGFETGRGRALSGSFALTMSPIAILLLVFSSGCLVYSVKSHLLPSEYIENDAGAKSFYIANDTFYKDGSPFRILGGDLHYFRIHPQYWEDRLQRAKALGLNSVQTYVPWNLHQPQPEKFNFEGGANLEGYLKLVQKLGLLVMLRIGPYICAEWDFGGFPAWLLAVRPELSLRTSDPQYLKLVDAWWDVLIPKIVPYLYCHQGPVIMVQIENEYGSFGADRSYMEHLVAKVRALLGEDIIVYTTDGAVSINLEHGSVEGSGVYTAVDFPTEWDPATAFAIQKQYNARGNSPSLSSEFYTGWLTHWGEQLAQTDPEYTAAALDRILYLNASVVLYMLHGGTNFGFTSGSNTGSSVHDFLPDITSYDYDAPIGEAGDIDNRKFQALKAVLARYSLESPPSPPPLPTRKAFGPLQLYKLSSLFHILEYISTDPRGVLMDQPSSMETVHQISGFILYRTNLPSHAKAGSKICISKVHDRAQVFISGIVEGYETTSTRYIHVGTLERWSSDTLWLPSNVTVPGLQLDILVENMGRVNYGPFVYDPKGILSAVLLDETPIVDWISFSIPLDSKLPPVVERVSDRKTERTSRALAENCDKGNYTDGPSFYRGLLTVEKPADTFLSVVGWSKGVAFLNGFNLGRYWPVKGPQCSYYIPAPLLYAGDNELILLELDNPSTDLWVNFTDAPDYSCHGSL
ncbi:hypothetical protein Mapa_009934 [Marchantia paleacea]|nr:hypothetical protein Mapa_009934 [Marchantia paleacea]